MYICVNQNKLIMVLPRKENLTDKMIIDIMNARFFNENPVNVVGKYDRENVERILADFYYGEDVVYHMEYTEHIIKVLKDYAIIDYTETIDSLIRDGKMRRNKEISKALSSPEVQKAMKDLVDTVKDKYDKLKTIFITKEVAKKEFNLN